MWRSQLRAMLLSPSPRPLTTLLTRSSNSSRPRLFALHKTLSFHSHPSFRSPTALNFPASSAFVVPVRCLSSIFPANTLEWNEPVSCSEVGDADGEGRSLGEEDSRTSIPVRAYFFSTRFVLGWFSFLCFCSASGMGCLVAEKMWERKGKELGAWSAPWFGLQ